MSDIPSFDTTSSMFREMFQSHTLHAYIGVHERSACIVWAWGGHVNDDVNNVQYKQVGSADSLDRAYIAAIRSVRQFGEENGFTYVTVCHAHPKLKKWYIPREYSKSDLKKLNNWRKQHKELGALAGNRPTVQPKSKSFPQYVREFLGFIQQDLYVQDRIVSSEHKMIRRANKTAEKAKVDSNSTLF